MKRLLIIEDMALESEAVKRIYEMIAPKFHEPIQINIVATWKAALEEVEHNRPDVVLLDLGLPDSGTDETVTKIGEMSKSWPPIVVLTGNDVREQELRIKCIRDNGASDLLLKKLVHRNWEFLVERIWQAYLRRQHEQR